MSEAEASTREEISEFSPGDPYDCGEPVPTDTTEIPEDLEEEMKQGMGCWPTFLFFLKHTTRDVRRHKCHFGLACCSVFVAVFSTLVINTVISKGPVIFMSLAQQDSG